MLGFSCRVLQLRESDLHLNTCHSADELVIAECVSGNAEIHFNEKHYNFIAH